MKLSDSVELTLRKLANETRIATIDAILNLIDDAPTVDHARALIIELKRASLVEQLKQPIIRELDPDS